MVLVAILTGLSIRIIMVSSAYSVCSFSNIILVQKPYYIIYHNILSIILNRKCGSNMIPEYISKLDLFTWWWSKYKEYESLFKEMGIILMILFTVNAVFNTNLHMIIILEPFTNFPKLPIHQSLKHDITLIITSNTLHLILSSNAFS